jgi:hypothetical protein
MHNIIIASSKCTKLLKSKTVHFEFFDKMSVHFMKLLVSINGYLSMSCGNLLILPFPIGQKLLHPLVTLRVLGPDILLDTVLKQP